MVHIDKYELHYLCLVGDFLNDCALSLIGSRVSSESIRIEFFNGKRHPLAYCFRLSPSTILQSLPRQ